MLGGAAVLLTWRQWWTDLGHWLAGQPSASILAGWPAVLAVVLAGAGYTALRRTTP